MAKKKTKPRVHKQRFYYFCACSNVWNEVLPLNVGATFELPCPECGDICLPGGEPYKKKPEPPDLTAEKAPECHIEKRRWLVAHPDNYNEFVDVWKDGSEITAYVKTSNDNHNKLAMTVTDSGSGFTIKGDRIDLHLAYCDLDYIRMAIAAISLAEERNKREAVYYELKV